MNQLQRFNTDKANKQTLLEYIHDFIDREALKRVYGNESVSSVSEARKLIDLAFENLDIIYAKEPERKLTNDAK
jgi:hypothetical protein